MRPPASSPPPQPAPHPSSSSPEDQSSKRPLSPPTENGNQKRRRLSTDQARGKRMFGALMGTLNSFQKQTSKDSTRVEKRAEIDARVKEKVAKEQEELAIVKTQQEKERKLQEEENRIKLESETVLFPLPARCWMFC